MLMPFISLLLFYLKNRESSRGSRPYFIKKKSFFAAHTHVSAFILYGCGGNGVNEEDKWTFSKRAFTYFPSQSVRACETLGDSWHSAAHTFRTWVAKRTSSQRWNALCLLEKLVLFSNRKLCRVHWKAYKFPNSCHRLAYNVFIGRDEFDFHRKKLYLIYQIRNKLENYESVEFAREICNKFSVWKCPACKCTNTPFHCLKTEGEQK